MMSKHIEQLTEVKLTLNGLVKDMVNWDRDGLVEDMVMVTNKLGRIISKLDEEIGER